MSEQTDQRPRGMGDFAVYASPDELESNRKPVDTIPDAWDELNKPYEPEQFPTRRTIRESEQVQKHRPKASRLADAAGEDLLSGQEIYQDIEKVAPVKGHKFPADTSLTVGHRNAYRVNARGAVIFSPGWNPSKVARVHLRSALIWVFIIAASAGGSWYMYENHVGSDRVYNEMLSQGQTIPVKVSDSQVDIEESSNGYTTVRNVTETATAPFATDTGKKGTVKVSTLQEIRLDAEYEPAYPKGSTIHIATDPENPKNYVVVNPDAPGQFNWISGSPLVIGLFGLVGLMSRLFSAIRMSGLGRSMKRAMLTKN